MAKMGFYFDMSSCIGCKTCQIACKDKNDLRIGMFFRHVHHYEVGQYPHMGTFNRSATCNHCESPACVAACPNGSMHILEEDGTVQHDYSKCIGCKYCVEACPYGVPMYDSELGQAVKCNACIELRGNGEQPACVSACPMRALEFGPIDALEARHPDAVRPLPILPEPSITRPCTIINPRPSVFEQDPVEVQF